MAMERLSAHILVSAFVATAACLPLAAQHDHAAPEKLGAVEFTTSCSPQAQAQFNRAAALLHSFAYSESEKAFRQVLTTDPGCAMAHWGIAMTYYHQLWEPPINETSYATGAAELALVTSNLKRSERESGFIDGLAEVYSNGDGRPLRKRMLTYEARMAEVAITNTHATETQVFYALALLSTATPSDKTHANQKKAASILEPLYAQNPEHPGIAHYLIHACDNSEMAQQGVKAADEYTKIAPSAPHALHMPSHIYTRLGMWNESVESNQAARRAAQHHGDVGEELHAMDYLTYAYLQLGRNEDAVAVVAELQQMREVQGANFKVGYAATAMPVRLAVERGKWQEAAVLNPAAGAPPEVSAVAAWARAIGSARLGKVQDATLELERLRETKSKLRAAGNSYWSDQVSIQALEVEAWITAAQADDPTAKKLLTRAADFEDSMEKLPLTPGPIVPAREQLGELLLQMNQPSDALQQFEVALQQSPGRRNALLGAKTAAELSKNKQKSELYAAELQKLPQR